MDNKGIKKRKFGNVVEFFSPLWYITIKESTCCNRCFFGKLPIDG